MNRILFFLGTILACIAVNPVQAGEIPDRQVDRDFILRAEQAIAQAYVTGKDREVTNLLSDEYRGIDSRGGISDKADTLKIIREGADESAAVIEAIDIQFQGNTAIARIHEKDTGNAPAFETAWRVITDTWVRQAGKWRLLAAEELNPGAPTLKTNEAAIGEVKASRNANNRAIAAHDLSAVLPIFADDAVLLWSDGRSANGKAELKSKIAADFADPAFVTELHSTDSVAIADAGVSAVEHGTWTAIKSGSQGETRYGGDYMAQWVSSTQGWRIKGEIYVKLRCSGPLCHV